MAYSPPHTFGDGAALQAAELEANNGASFDYINAQIATGDLQTANFDTQDLQAGYAVIVTEDVRFPTGDVYSHRHDALGDSSQRRYLTGTIKTQSPTGQAVYVSIPGAAREIFMSSAGDVIIEAAGVVEVLASISGRAYLARTTPTPVLVDSRFYVEVDGVVRTNSVSYAFTEESGTPSAQSVASGALVGEGAFARRPLYLFWAEANLSAGWHTIRIVGDPRAERMFNASLSLQIEALHDGGYTSYTGSTL